MAAIDAGSLDEGQLRERLAPQSASQNGRKPQTARERVLELNEEEELKDEKEKRTYGRTPDGTGKLLVNIHPTRWQGTSSIY
jgi:phosphatidylethanolamine N-methyltransferase